MKLVIDSLLGFHTLSRRVIPRLALVLLSLVLLASCRSEQIAFDFGPPPGRPRPIVSPSLPKQSPKRNQQLAPLATLSAAPSSKPTAKQPETVRQTPEPAGIGLPTDSVTASPTSLAPKTRLSAVSRQLPPSRAQQPAASRHPAGLALKKMFRKQLQQLATPQRSRDSSKGTEGPLVNNPLLMALLVFTAGVLLIIGGLQLAFSLGVLPGILVGAVAVIGGLILMLLSVAAATGNPNGQKSKVTPFMVLGWLLLAFGLSPLLGLTWALVFPGCALLALSLGIMLTFTEV